MTDPDLKTAALGRRMKPLAPRHRRAHLRALLRREAIDSKRHEILHALQRDQTPPRRPCENRLP
jgi:hypothetical protein